MTLDADLWRKRGRGVRSLETELGMLSASTRAEARDAVLFGLATVVLELDATELEAVLDLATDGYVAEHLARGGTLAA